MKKGKISERRQQTPSHDNALAPDAIRKPAEKNEERSADQKGAPDECVQRREILEAKRLLEEKQGIELSSVPDNPLTGGRAEKREPDIFCVRHPQEAVAQRRRR